MRDIDLIIVGSGPAGISTALHLLQFDPGWVDRMIMIEKASHPRPKLCGGGMTRLGVEVLKQLGIQFPLPIPQEWVVDARFVYRGRTIHIRGIPLLIIFHRAELDEYLVEQARSRGVIIHQNETVEQISFDKKRVVVKTNRELYPTRVLVGADGAMGVTRRTFLEHGEKSRVARTLDVISPAPLTASEVQEGFAIFDFSSTSNDLQGYYWVFPALVGGLPHFNRGIYDARMASSRARAKLPDLLKKGLATSVQDPQQVRVDGHPILCFSPRNRLSMPRLLLVGDAAGVDPLFGEGIAPALAYGQVAAAALTVAFTQADFSFEDYRRRVLLSPLGHYLMVRWVIAWVSYQLSGSPLFMHTLWTMGYLANRIFKQPEPLAKRPARIEHTRSAKYLIKD
jgi:flavin-dependent dehydrogenase